MILRRRQPAEREAAWRHPFWPAPSVDRFVVSYPKAGRTWLRVMLAAVEASARGRPGGATLDEWLRQDAPQLDGRRVLFTHALATSSAERDGAVDAFLHYIGAHRRVFLVRDPRDVVVSHFFQLRRRAGRAVDLGSPGELARDSRRGVDRVLRFMAACERALREDRGPSLLVSYEELHRDPAAALVSVLELFDASADDEVVQAAAERASFERMQELERANRSPSVRKLGARDRVDPESLKVRRGEVGGYSAYLSTSDVEYLQSRIEALLPESLGYREPGVPPDARPRATAAAVSLAP